MLSITKFSTMNSRSCRCCRVRLTVVWRITAMHSSSIILYTFSNQYNGFECENLGYMKAWEHRSSVRTKRLEAPSSLRQSHSNMGWLGTSHTPTSTPASLCKKQTRILKTMNWKKEKVSLLLSQWNGSCDCDVKQTKKNVHLDFVHRELNWTLDCCNFMWVTGCQPSRQ